MKWIYLILIPFLMLQETPVSGEDSALFRSWVETMKTSPRGPFSRIRWFCKDGSVLDPEPYACRERGGGVQHGEWTREVRAIRAGGYFIATVYADLVPDLFMKQPAHVRILTQMMLEQFLINADDGWIFRNARYYRGALQAEGEAVAGRYLLQRLLETYHHTPGRFLWLRETVRLLPHHRRNAPVSQMRQLTLSIAEADENFKPLRVKIHVRPEAADADLVRAYAEKDGRVDLKDDYEQLAKIIESVFRPADLTPLLFDLAGQMAVSPASGRLRQGAEKLEGETDPLVRFEIAARLTVTLRDAFYRVNRPDVLLSVLDVSVFLEDELFRLAADIMEILPGKTLARSLDLLAQSADIAYGTGLISQRQHRALKDRLANAEAPGRDLGRFRSDLMYLSRISEWSEQNLLFHFAAAVERFQAIEPLAGRYVHDRLHSSLLLIYSSVLARLTADNSRQLGITSRIWGNPAGLGVNGLNPGLSRGILREPAPGEDPGRFSTDSILLLPATTANLPPVSGVITAGRGNSLSHVQLLARNLGIPNVAVDKTLLPDIRSRIGRRIVLAVSPGGVVRIARDGPEWDSVFAWKTAAPRAVLKSDTEKPDLSRTGFVDLRNIRAKDSGRIAGPKAANLGELKHHFPGAVTDGVVIPFGVFRKILDQPFHDPGRTGNANPTLFDWMTRQYRKIDDLKTKPAVQRQLIHKTLAHVRARILETDPGEAFQRALKEKLENTLGPDGSYGVFVRSDTNVEDLPGFTGAGLNLTVPHVIGFDNIMAAVRRVWASVFSDRSFGWRHAYLKNPEHVYVSVLLMKTIPVEKSGVMITRNLATGESGWLTIAVNEGVGGAVSGQSAEELQIHVPTGQVTLLSQAAEPLKRVILDTGGVGKEAASGTDTVLTPVETARLTALAKQVPEKFPIFRNNEGRAVAADVEFGFLKGRLVLFQIRPLVEDTQTLQNQYLSGLDRKIGHRKSLPVVLDRVPLQVSP